MSDKLGQEPAFPIIDTNSNLATWNAGLDPTGISKRFYAACAAMQGILSNPVICDNSLTKQKIVSDSFEFADELLKQEHE